MVEPSSTTVTGHISSLGIQQIFLKTAIVQVEDATGNNQNCRIMLDDGSMGSFITEACVKRLGMKRLKAHTNVSGVGGTSFTTRGMVNIKVKSRISTSQLHVHALIYSKLTGQIPISNVDTSNWSHILGLNLADPGFSKPGEVDILLGNDVYDLIVLEDRIRRKGLPTAQSTEFGWVITGPQSLEGTTSRPGVYSHLATLTLEAQLQKFWELEDVEVIKRTPTQEEVACENHFASTFTRDTTGRYVAAFPFKDNKLELGKSRDMAIMRLKHVERKLARLPQHKKTYADFMDQYLNLGHMECIPDSEVKEVQNKTNYLPHHFVLKESTTTPFRVVFDASAKTNNGLSLNEQLLVGPRLQSDIFDILLRFRTYNIAFTADIAKMYRQTRMRDEDANLQRIVWRASPEDEINDYRLTTVTYGTASGPYLSAKTLQQLAQDEGHDFPLAKDIVLQDCYVDDIMAGADTIEAALVLQVQLISMLQRCGMQIRKWTSNSTQLLEALPEGYTETQLPLSIDSDDTVKAFGLLWHPAKDHFFFKVSLDPITDIINKRQILSDVAKLYDPMGWLAPVIIIGKILLQKLWKISGLGWDNAIPLDIINEWTNFRISLFELNNFRLHRCVGMQSACYQIHGFCDASELAYGAAVYIRLDHQQHGIHSHLLCSKTKVAPVKVITLPRLELCGAVLLAKLLNKVKRILQIKIDETYAWTDSTITLAWVTAPSTRWKTFVANRVTKVQELVEAHWRHVRSGDNPADLASRGIPPAQLMDNHLWWHGPDWLIGPETSWPQLIQHADGSDANTERKKLNLIAAPVIEESCFTKRFSSLHMLQYVTAWCFRFCLNAKKSKDSRYFGQLTSLELSCALHHWIKVLQQRHFLDTIDQINNKKSVTTKLSSLNPFLDSSGLLRVGGRLKHSRLSYDQKYPILIPRSHLADLIIQHEHLRLLHAGPQLLLASIQKQYWIPHAKKIVRQHVFKCVKCYRLRAQTLQQQMGDLPSYRLEPTRSFLRTGIDYGGPIQTKTVKGRGGRIVKSYIALFVCCSTKAIHLELVSDLSSEAFISSLKRFIARRGIPSDIYSDNGTNFVGASNELKELYKLFNSQQHQKKVTASLASNCITWHFIPARAPHFGGLWEAGIKSVKGHLYRVVGRATLTFEELTTTLCQIEACLNSRPLTPMSTDPTDLDVLTPGHFIIESSLTAIPEPDITHLNVNRLSRWQLIQHLTQHFWKRWHSEYLVQLQQRSKWHAQKENLKIGDLVLIKEDNSPSLHWLMGRVVETFPGQDGSVRVVKVKTKTGVLKRPIVKLCLLPVDSTSSS